MLSSLSASVDVPMVSRKARLFFSTSRCELQRRVTRQLSKTINQKLSGTDGLSEESNTESTFDPADPPAPSSAAWESRGFNSTSLASDGKRPFLHRNHCQPKLHLKRFHLFFSLPMAFTNTLAPGIIRMQRITLSQNILLCAHLHQTHKHIYIREWNLAWHIIGDAFMCSPPILFEAFSAVERQFTEIRHNIMLLEFIFWKCTLKVKGLAP